MEEIYLYQYGEYKKASGEGVNEYLYLQCQLLKSQINYNFIVFKSKKKQKSYRLQELNNVRIYNFHTPDKFLSVIYGFPPGFKKWLKSLSGRKGVIFHLHSVFRIDNFFLARLLNKYSIPFIFTPHDSYSEWSLRKNYFIKIVYLHLFEKYILNSAKYIHAISDRGKYDIEKYTNNRVITVQNFIADPGYIVDAIYRKRRLCYVGRMDIFQKGIDLMMAAFDRFLLNDDSRTQFYLVGKQSKTEISEFNEIMSKISKNAIENIIHLGYLSNEEKNKTLSNSYVYFQLSRFEGFGLSVVEALAFGIPVIISNLFPFYKVIEDYGCGYVVTNVSEASD
ncbi:MAG TPA: glycosyltransferase, partial [Anaerolineaceae bacterium]|nr:glycosyltransferase [Anaerolineaceae bacterium]